MKSFEIKIYLIIPFQVEPVPEDLDAIREKFETQSVANPKAKKPMFLLNDDNTLLMLSGWNHHIYLPTNKNLWKHKKVFIT